MTSNSEVHPEEPTNDAPASLLPAVIEVLPLEAPEDATAILTVKAEHRAEVALPRELQSIVGQYLENFLSDRTREAYVSDWRDFFAWMAEAGFAIESLSDVTDSHIIGYRNFLREKYSPTSITRKLSALSSLFAKLKDEQIVRWNPASGLKRPKAIAKKKRTGFTDQEVNRLLDSIGTESLKDLSDKALLSFLFYTGARVSEMLSVRVKDLDQVEGVPVVHLRGKGEKLRTLPIVKVKGLIDELVQRRGKGKDDYVFTAVYLGCEKPMTRGAVNRLLKARLKGLGMDATRSVHSARRTVISNLLQAGERLEQVQKIAGHASPTITLRSYSIREEPMAKNPLVNLNYKD
jgi:site-specific recombinase XerD